MINAIVDMMHDRWIFDDIEKRHVNWKLRHFIVDRY